MLKPLFVSVFIFFFSSISFGQTQDRTIGESLTSISEYVEGIEINSNRIFSQPASNDLLEAEFLIRSHNQIKSLNSASSRYPRFHLIQQIVGSVDVQNRTLLEMNFNKAFQRFNPDLFQNSSIKKAMVETSRILKTLHEFSQTIDAKEASTFAKEYNGQGLSIRKSIKDGMYHLPSEMARFAFAIVAVRMATCFGPSLAPLMQFTTPNDIKASIKDPACIYEIAEMLQSPLFYIGFSGFVLASRGASTGVLKLLNKIDPAKGRVSKAFAAAVLPNIALAAGFFTDHMIQTFAHNKDLTGCAKNIGSGVVSSLIHNIDKSKIGEDDNGDTYLGFYDQLGSSHCQRAGRYLSSTQFLAEDMGIGLTGLIAASTALTGATIALNSIKKISFVFSATGVGGFIVGTARMVVFLGIYEVIEPLIKNKYYDSVLKPRLDGYSLNLSRSAQRLKGETIKLNEQKTCSKHYSGFLDGENLEMCTQIPILAELYTFRDYAHTWRTKRILGEFFESLSHWKKKLTSFITHYFSAMEHLKILARSREIRLTQKSDYYKEFELKSKEAALKFIVEKYPQHEDPQAIFSHIEKLHDDFMNHPDQSVSQRAKETVDQNPHDRYVFDIIHRYKNHNNLVDSTLRGNHFFGLGLAQTGEYYPSLEYLEQIRKKAIRFLKSGVSARFLMHGGRSYQQLQHLDAMGVKRGEVQLETPEALIRLIRSGDKDSIALGFLLYSEWKPFFFGNESISTENPRGLNQSQKTLYDDLELAFKDFIPLFKYDAIYFEYTGLKDYLFKREKTADDSQWASRDFYLNTELLTDLSLAELMCGHQDSFLNSFFGHQGTALEFKYPHLSNEDHCSFYFYPIYYDDEMAPAPTRTVFTTYDGFRTGLHQIYIQAKSDEPSTHIFDSEQEAGDWWNTNYRQPSLTKLRDMNDDYEHLLKEDFTPKFDTSGLSTLNQWIDYLNPFKNPFDQSFSEIAKTKNASESLYYELSQYLDIITKIAPPKEGSSLAQSVESLPTCYVEMLDNISSKNYSTVKSKCIEIRNNIKDNLWYNNESRSDADVQGLLRKNENELSSEELKDVILLHVYTHIEKAFSEVDLYQNIQNGQFKFNLDLEGEQE